MKTVSFRKHRGSLVESLDTTVLVSSKEDIAMVCTDETIDINPDLIEIAPCVGYDYRVGWYTHVVIYPDYGVLGFTDGNITELEMMKHTKEPWVAEKTLQGRSSSISNRHGKTIAIAYQNGNIDGDDLANAKRIVACVNACEGINDAVIEAGIIEEALVAYLGTYDRSTTWNGMKVWEDV